SRFGFSDILTALLALDCDVILYHQGRISLEEFTRLPYEKDILTHICIKKKNYRGVFLCVRKSATDLSVLNMAMTKNNQYYRIVIGARPQKAKCMTVSQNLSHNEIIERVKLNMPCQSNMRSSQEYREKLEEALLLKAFKKLEDE
ncbi:MAG: 4-hydroxybenzoyl-CoA reductase, partial [Faecalibacillus sp.]